MGFRASPWALEMAAASVLVRGRTSAAASASASEKRLVPLRGSREWPWVLARALASARALEPSLEAA